MYAAALGQVAPDLHIEGGRYAMAGMAALLTATVRAPLTGLALILEITGNFPLTGMALLASVVADVTATLLAGQPVYETLRERTIALNPPPASQKQRPVAHAPGTD